MRYSGPLAVWIFNILTDADAEYRLLRNTTPWKHIGFFLGSLVIVGGLISLTESQLSLRSFWIAALVSLALILIYDVPFDDLLLPPNGDV